jgi:hypothetical protein
MMSRWHAWYSHLATVIVSATGILYCWMKYFVVSDDPFSVINHPLQPYMLDLHLLTAPLFVFAFGLIFESHIQRKLKIGISVNRRSGLAAVIMFWLMVLSGYGLQIGTSDTFSRTSLVLHLASSALFFVSYLMHQAVTFRQWRLREAA